MPRVRPGPRPAPGSGRSLPDSVRPGPARPDSALPRRAVVDYGLQRRSVLAGLAAGRLSRDDACDAHPYLLRAARHHGEQTARPCPVCPRGRLVDVRYVYGDSSPDADGRVRSAEELRCIATAEGTSTVYVVEVCRRCAWNHLVTSYVLGDGRGGSPAGRPRRAAGPAAARPSAGQHPAG